MMKSLKYKLNLLLSVSVFNTGLTATQVEQVEQVAYLSDVILMRNPHLKERLAELVKEQSHKDYNARDDINNDTNGMANRLGNIMKSHLDAIICLYQIGYMDVFKYGTGKLLIQQDEDIFFLVNSGEQKKDRYPVIKKISAFVVLTLVYIGIMHLAYGSGRNIYSYLFRLFTSDYNMISSAMMDFSSSKTVIKNDNFEGEAKKIFEAFGAKISKQDRDASSESETKAIIEKIKMSFLFYKMSNNLTNKECDTLDSVIEKMFKPIIEEGSGERKKDHDLNGDEETQLLKLLQFLSNKEKVTFTKGITPAFLVYGNLFVLHSIYISFIIRSDIEYTYFFNLESIAKTNIFLILYMAVTVFGLKYYDCLNLQTFLFHNLQMIMIQAAIMINWYVKFTTLNKRVLNLVAYMRKDKFYFDSSVNKIAIKRIDNDTAISNLQTYITNTL